MSLALDDIPLCELVEAEAQVMLVPPSNYGVKCDCGWSDFGGINEMQARAALEEHKKIKASKSTGDKR